MKTKLGEIIKGVRESKNISKRRLAYLVGISDTEINRIENGERVHPNINIFINICKALDLDINEVLKECGYYDEDNKYTFNIKRLSKDSLLIESNNLKEVIELITKSSINIDEILSESNDEIEFELTDYNNEDDTNIIDFMY